MLEALPLELQRYLLERCLLRAHNTLSTFKWLFRQSQNLLKCSLSHLYVLTLDHRGAQLNPRKARASSHRNSRRRRSRRGTSFWLPAPNKSAVHVTLTKPLKHGATINGSGVYHSSRLSWGHFSENFPPKSPQIYWEGWSTAYRVSRITRSLLARRKLPNNEVVPFRQYTFRPNGGLLVGLRRLDMRIVFFRISRPV
jgi:hypothetical protein